jgi:hypothetical protein
MTKTTVLLALAITAVASMPAHAQQRVFVSGAGLDTNPCTVTQPCRTFQQAFNTAAANGEIDVIDPAGYGPLTITHGISIQAHGFGGITQTCPTCTAITVNVTTMDPVTLNGLLIDGGGTGNTGIDIISGSSVTILNSVVRHFANIGIDAFMSDGANLLIEDTVVSDIATYGFEIGRNGIGSIKATLNRITANNSNYGVRIDSADTTIANSVLSNNSLAGLDAEVGVTGLAKTVISGNPTGVLMGGGIVKSYGDNYLGDNGLPVDGSLMPVTTQ